MKIAYLGIKGLPSKSGTERVIEAIVNRLVGKYDITVYCDASYTPEDTKIDGVKLIRLATPKGKYLRPVSYNILCMLHALIKSNYDVIHVNGIETCFILPFLRLKYPIISTSHGSPHVVPREKWGKRVLALMGLLEYPFIFLSNYATSISKVDASYLESRYKRKVIYIPNGVDTDVCFNEIGSIKVMNHLGIKPNEFILFAAGRIDPSKGCHLAIEAYNNINIPVPLLIIGDLEQIPSYGKCLRQMGAGKNIIFFPPIQDKSIFLSIVKSCKFFIFPSLSEGMSIMLLEAASLGVPIICSDILENKFVVKDFALYFKSGNAKELAEKLYWAYQFPEKMAYLSRQAQTMSSSELSWDKIVYQYENLYNSLGNR